MTRSTHKLLGLLALLLGLSPGVSACAAFGASSPPPLTRDRMRESLEQAVSWKNPSPQVVLQLAGDYLATGREREGYAYFEARAAASPGDSLFVGVAGMLQARMAGQVPLWHRVAWVEAALAKLDQGAAGNGLARYLRGIVEAELPTRFHRADQAVSDLNWALSLQPSPFPPGFARGAWRGLARAYRTLERGEDAANATRKAGGETVVAGPLFLIDGSVSAEDGFRFTPPEVSNPSPGVYVVRGYDFADLSFIVTSEGVVAIDAGTTPGTAAAALAAFRKISMLPIRALIVTHAHWDHIGGLAALREPGTRVYAQAGYAAELTKVNRATNGFKYFFGAKAADSYQLKPDVVIDQPTTLTFGDTTLLLIPEHGGETDDALMAYLPAQRVLFVGDTFMPYFGAPFSPEGSLEGLFATMDEIDGLAPALLIHGHLPLTQLFTRAALPALREALVQVRDGTIAGVHAGRSLPSLLGDNLMPAPLSTHPDAVAPFLLMRDNLVQRLFSQGTGYWKSDGEGVAVYSSAEWGAALNLLGGGRESAFVEASKELEARGDHGMSFEIARLGLATFPASQALAAARLRAVEGLRLQNQFNPFKFIVYSELSGEGLPPPASGPASGPATGPAPGGP